MTRAEILNSAKPILFNTEMVRAIIDGRKTQTRRVVNINTDTKCSHGEHEFVRDDFGNTYDYTGFVCRKCGFGVSPPHCKYPVGTSVFRSRYNIGDILYARETWVMNNITPHDPEWLHKADYDCSIYPYCNWKWKPSIHMPKEAARIFLRVTGVRAERLQDICAEDCVKEGIPEESLKEVGADFTVGQFHDLWNSTIKKKDLPLYGWEANPWVWVYEFERIEVEENDQRFTRRRI